MTKYNILRYNEIDPDRRYSKSESNANTYTVGIFTDYRHIKKYLDSNHHMYEVKGSTCIDDEIQSNLKGDNTVFCLIRYTCDHAEFNEVLYVSTDLDEIYDKCNKDVPMSVIHQCEYEYYYKEYILNIVNYEAQNISIPKEDISLDQYIYDKY